MKSEKFLEFNGHNIVFVDVEGTYHVAIKPICEALKVDVRRSRELAKNDPILGPEVSEQALQVVKNGKKQRRNMTCIPEEFIYGWIFSLRSDSAELIKYKKECYHLLYKHFHGSVTNRKELVLEKTSIERRIKEIKNILKSDDPVQRELLNLELKKKKVVGELNNLDKKLIADNELFPDAD